MRKLVTLAFTAVFTAALFPAAQAATIAITARDNAFSPDLTKASVGQQVTWSNAESAEQAHNVKADGKLFYSGFPGSVQWSYTRVFSAGTFHYFCETHGFPGGGMDGNVKVPVKLGAAPSGPNFTVTWATAASNTGSKYTIQYKIGSGAWKTWKSATTAVSATFTSARAGTRYTFRAKSKEGTATSKWSPLAAITS